MIMEIMNIDEMLEVASNMVKILRNDGENLESGKNGFRDAIKSMEEAESWLEQSDSEGEKIKKINKLIGELKEIVGE